MKTGQQKLDQQLMTLRMVSVMFLAMPVILAGLIWFDIATANISGGNDATITALMVLAVVQLAIAPVFGKVMMKNALAGSSEKTAQGILASYSVSFIVTRAIWEAVAIFGFLIYMLGGNKMLAIGLCGLAMLPMIIYWPRREHITNILREHNLHLEM